MRSVLPLLLLFAGACRESMGPPESPLGTRKAAATAWENLLTWIVDENGLVDYDLLEQHRGRLDAYIAWLATEEAWPGKLTKDWHAQYLNAYNALVLYQVLERGRPASVLDVQGILPIGGYRFFHGTQFLVGDGWITLSEIENERVRHKELDYRDHAALNCASKSCPPLRNELYKSKGLTTQLDDQFARWMNDEQRGVRIEDGEAVFSPIFDWYAHDFDFFTAGIDPCTLAASVIRKPKVRQQLYELSAQGCPRRYFDYDWSLNDSPR